MVTVSKPRKIYMPVYFGDWLQDTSSLSQQEQGAYFLLVAMYWNNGGKIDDKMTKIFRATSAHTRTEKKTTKYILDTYFLHQDGYYIHPRIDKELQEAIEKQTESIERARHAANIRWGKNNMPEHMQKDMQKQCPGNANHNQPKGYNNINNQDNSITPRESGHLPIWELISNEAHEQAAYYAEGWDKAKLEELYNKWIKNNGGMPRNLNKAFPAWVEKFTKGKPPK